MKFTVLDPVLLEGLFVRIDDASTDFHLVRYHLDQATETAK